MNDPQQVRDLLIQNGLADKADALMALLQPSIRIFTERADDATIPVGASKIGGEPDLPLDFEWPIWEHEPSDSFKAILALCKQPLPEKRRPLGFLAQFNLAEVAPYDMEHLLPSRGMLYFFYDGVELPGTESLRGGGARILYYPETEVRRTLAPPNLPNESRFELCSLIFKPELTLPSALSSYVEYTYTTRIMYPNAVHFTEEEIEDYEAVEQMLLENSKTTWGTIHRLLGHPQQVQDALEVRCEVEVSGAHLEGDYSEQWHTASKDARRWRLVLQLDSDDYSNMMWGDVGKLYFCLPEEALSAQRFEDGMLILQAH